MSKLKGIISAFVVLSVLVIGIIATYPYILKNYSGILEQTKVEEQRINEERSKDAKNEFMDMLFRSNYSLYSDIVQQNRGEALKPSEIFLPDYGKNTNPNKGLSTDNYGNGNSDSYEIDLNQNSDSYEVDMDQDGGTNTINNFNIMLEDWHEQFYNNNINNYGLEYYIVDNETKKYITNTSTPLDQMINDEDATKHLENSYSFYSVFQYDKNGKLQIPVFLGLEKEQKDWYITRDLTKKLINEGFLDNWYQYANLIQGPSNVTIIYGTNVDDFYNHSNNYYSYFSGEREAFTRAGFIQVFCGALLILFLISIVFSFGKENKVRKLAGKIPGEISLVLVFLPFMLYDGLLSMAKETVGGRFLDLSYLLISTEAEKIFNYGINYFVWLVTLSISLLSLISLWQVFSLGLKRYLKERTIFGWCFIKLRGFLRSLKDIDLTDSSNKAIFKILAVNFVILAILCSIWVAGIFALIVYTIILFFVVRKYVNTLKAQYLVLMSATSKMAKGNLEVVIDEDLGIFNPLKEELSKVQYGFKTAVDEEMKSQKMKTELITNVSHDLKTPLTAIITYVNLLKDENITEEERNSYIDTLDKKSMRLKVLIEDLFEMSKANSNNIQFNLVEVDIVSLIKQVQLELGDKIEESKLEFRNRFSNERVVLNLDSEKTYRIFENLIVNITKYSLPDTRAFVEVFEDENQVTIILKNTSATELDFTPDEITERFVRGDKSRNTEGSGLGLAIAKSFVEPQGGKMEIQVDGDLFKVIIKFKKN